MPSTERFAMSLLLSPGNSRCHQTWKWRLIFFCCFLLANGLIVWLGKKPGEYDGLLYSSQGSDEGDATTMLANYIREASLEAVQIDSRKGWQNQFQSVLWACLLTKATRYSNSSWSCHCLWRPPKTGVNGKLSWPPGLDTCLICRHKPVRGFVHFCDEKTFRPWRHKLTSSSKLIKTQSNWVITKRPGKLHGVRIH